MIDKNLTNILLFRKEVFNTEPFEKEHEITLPPIFKSFYSVFEPYFGVEKYKPNKSSDLKSFTSAIYSSLELENYTFEHDEFAFQFFKGMPELLTFEPSNMGYAKDLLFIAEHGYWGGLMVGIGEHNCDKIFHNTGTKVVTFLANNIFELIHKMVAVHQEVDEPWIDTKKLYKNWEEGYWRIKPDQEV